MLGYRKTTLWLRDLHVTISKRLATQLLYTGLPAVRWSFM